MAVSAVCCSAWNLDCCSPTESGHPDGVGDGPASPMKALGEKFAAGRGKCLCASITVEAAGVMSIVLLTIMVLMGQAMSWNSRAAGMFALHETVERECHQIEHAEERTIKRQAEGNGWSLEISAPVFRPEKALRMWSLVEDIRE